jgi:ABC-2 type transport system permease protein
MRNSVRAEWTKLRTVPSTGWLLLTAVGFTIALGFAIVGTTDANHCQAPCTVDTTKLSLAGVRLGQTGIVILAALAVTAEYGTRTIRATLAATPRRLVVLASKLTVVTVLSLAAGVAGVLGSLLAARTVLPSNGFTRANGFPPLSLTDELTRRAAIGTVLYLGLIAVLSVGVGAIVRDTAGAVSTVLALLYGAPMAALLVSNPRWQHRIHRFAPMDAGLAIQSTRDFATVHIGGWAGLGVLAGYAGAAILVGALLFQLRDAQNG